MWLFHTILSSTIQQEITVLLVCKAVLTLKGFRVCKGFYSRIKMVISAQFLFLRRFPKWIVTYRIGVHIVLTCFLYWAAFRVRERSLPSGTDSRWPMFFSPFSLTTVSKDCGPRLGFNPFWSEIGSSF